MKKLITTPIYYVNDVPHIGHAYTTIIADMLKKYQWLNGDEVFLLTGTDEHGQKIEQSAKQKHKTPQAYTDEISAVFRRLWDSMEIDYDYFIRTTDDYHKASIVKVFERLCENGDVYLGEYEGDYCVSCESFFLNVDSGICPDCAGAKPLSKIKEESYFFALSKYQDKLLAWYASSNDVILPHYRKNEVIRFVENGLQDLSISRTSFEWGVALPQVRLTQSANNASIHIAHKDAKDAQKKHIAYVWLDALFNYISALGFYNTQADNKAFWDNATHIVGKDILRFHAVYWPAFLMSLNLPLPKHIYAHGWWMRDGQKMSKSLGNVIEPSAFSQAYGVEQIRYYLLRETPFGQDGDFSQKLLCERINSELANDLGNLLNRVLGMSEKYTNLRIHANTNASAFERFSDEPREIERILTSFSEQWQTMQIKAYIESIWKLLHLGNASVAKYEPWNLYKNGDTQGVEQLLCLLANLLLKVAHALYPIMPRTAISIAQAFSLDITPESYTHFITHNSYNLTFTLQKTPPLFHKIESLLIPESSEPQGRVDSTHTGRAQNTNKHSPQDSKEKAPTKAESKTNSHIEGIAQIDITDFSKLDIRVGEVLAAQSVPKSSKLLRLQIDIGESEPRVVLSGIAQYYTPESLIGTQVCMIANLKPAKIMGQFSYGMILASKDEESLSLVRIDGKRRNGSRIS